MEITNFIDTELYILVPVLYVFGMMIKKSNIDDRWIPIILGALGIVLATVYKFAEHLPNNSADILTIIYAGFTQGILCAAGSVYANNIVKQIKQNDETKGKAEDESDSSSDSSSDSKDDNNLR